MFPLEFLRTFAAGVGFDFDFRKVGEAFGAEAVRVFVGRLAVEGLPNTVKKESLLTANCPLPFIEHLSVTIWEAFPEAVKV